MAYGGDVKIGGYEAEKDKWVPAIEITTKEGQRLNFIGEFSVPTEDQLRQLCVYLWSVFDSKKSNMLYDRAGKVRDEP